MNIFALMRLVRRAVLMNAVGDDGAMGGGASETVPQPAVNEPGPDSTPATPSEPEPTTMLEAIERTLDRPRDELGRFAPKAAEPVEAKPAETKPIEPKPLEVKPEQKPEDPFAIPQDATPAVQQRIQKLAHINREVTQRAEAAEQQVAYVRDTFQQHGIQREQFEQAASVIGMMNRGDFAGAQRILTQQLQQIALMTGKPIGAVDALSEFPDLRQAVDGLQLSEERALEVARARQQQNTMQEQQRRQQQVQQSTQAQEQAKRQGMQAVDEFCKQMAQTDVDYPAIEAQLLPEIQGLLQGVPPSAWKQVIATQYKLMKNAAASVRTSAPAAVNPLRPVGAASPKVAPNSMFEAMWGGPRA